MLCKIYGISCSVEAVNSDSQCDKTGVANSSSVQNFCVEFSDFLREYGFPYMSVIERPIIERFTSLNDRAVTLRFLCAELIVARKGSKKSKQKSKKSQITADLTDHLKRACITLNMPRPPPDIDVSKLLSLLLKSVTKAISSVPPDYLGKPMLPLEGLSEKQWSEVYRMGQVLDAEYTSRRETLIKRADCTVQSFKWSDRAKSKLEEIEAAYTPLRAAMQASPWGDVVPHLLAARNVQLLRQEKTSGSAAREFTSCPLNRILMAGQVPDRGGRTWEVEAPLPEMPAFQKRRAGGGRGRARGGRGGGGGGHGGYSGDSGSSGAGGGAGGAGGGAGGGRGGVGGGVSYGSFGSRPPSGISFGTQDVQSLVQNDIIFQVYFRSVSAVDRISTPVNSSLTKDLLLDDGDDDESGCVDGLVRNASCPNQTFYCCEDAKCLPLSDVCNGRQDCIGLSDESASACEWKKNHSGDIVNMTFIWNDAFTPCPLDYPFFCPKDNTCLAVGAICNGLTDCSDGFDESAVVCKAVSGYEEESISQTALNHSTVLMKPSDADIIATNRTLDGLDETAINYNKTDFSSFGEVVEVGESSTKELCKSPENENAIAADISIETGSSSNDHSTTVTNVKCAEMASNCTQGRPKSDQENPEYEFSNNTTLEATINTLSEEEKFIDVKECTEVPEIAQPSGESLATESFSSSDYNSTEETETNEAKENSDQTVETYSMAEESIKKATKTYIDTGIGQLVAGASELDLNSHSVIEEQSTPFSETSNEIPTAVTEKLALVPSLESTSNLSNIEQENKESTIEGLAESNNNTGGNDASHSLEADLRSNYSSTILTEPPVKFLNEPIEIPHTTESTLAESTSVPCNPLCKMDKSEAESFNKSGIGFVHHSYNFTDGLTLKKADIKSIMTRGSETEGEIAFPPLWIARVSSGSFFLCYGVLLADDGPSRWVLIPASCGRYLQSSAMLVHFGAGIDNYEIVARVEQGEFDRDARNGFSLLQLNSSENIKHFIPRGTALTGPRNDEEATCKLLAPRHGYIYSFQLQNVASEDPTVCSHKYGIDVTEHISCFSQSLCLQSGLGGVLTCTNLTLGFYLEGADCYQGQIGWPVLVSVVTSDVLKWIWLTTGKFKKVCGFVGDNGESFPWFTYFNLTTQSSGLCLGVYTQNGTFPLITSVRCLRQCLQSMDSMGEGCVLENVLSDNSWGELCAAKNIIQRSSAAVSPWLQCLVAHLASPDKKGVQFERVRVSAFKDCAGERFYSPFMIEQGLCISAMGAELNCSMWGEAGLVQCQRATDGLWEFVGVTQACFRTSQQRWFMRIMEL
ncbi:Protein FAM98A [Taenia solium]|eukprot:TsM_001034900 transcript=TsM_001034900 gene=TsM_001034900